MAKSLVDAKLAVDAVDAVLYAVLRLAQRKETLRYSCRYGALDERNSAVFDAVKKIMAELLTTGACTLRMRVVLRMYDARLANPEVPVDVEINFDLQEMASQDLSKKAHVAAKEALKDTFAPRVLEESTVFSVEYLLF